jgi:hypothetical protein
MKIVALFINLKTKIDHLIFGGAVCLHKLHVIDRKAKVSNKQNKKKALIAIRSFVILNGSLLYFYLVLLLKLLCQLLAVRQIAC